MNSLPPEERRRRRTASAARWLAFTRGRRGNLAAAHFQVQRAMLPITKYPCDGSRFPESTISEGTQSRPVQSKTELARRNSPRS